MNGDLQKCVTNIAEFIFDLERECRLDFEIQDRLKFA